MSDQPSQSSSSFLPGLGQSSHPQRLGTLGGQPNLSLGASNNPPKDGEKKKKFMPKIPTSRVKKLDTEVKKERKGGEERNRGRGRGRGRGGRGGSDLGHGAVTFSADVTSNGGRQAHGHSESRAYVPHATPTVLAKLTQEAPFEQIVPVKKEEPEIVRTPAPVAEAEVEDPEMSPPPRLFSSPNAAGSTLLCDRSGVALSEGMAKLVLFQFPHRLPMTTPVVGEELSEDALSLVANTPTPPPLSSSAAPLTRDISSLPSGTVGKIRVFKSGKAVLVMGGLEFDVSRGSSSVALQQLVCVEAEGYPKVGGLHTVEVGEGAIRIVGPVQDKLVITPDVASLIRQRNGPTTTTTGGPMEVEEGL